MGEELPNSQPDAQDLHYETEARQVDHTQERNAAVEAAAVRPSGEKMPLTKAEEEDRDRALRVRNAQPPLTEQDIARLTEHRGKRPTPDEIDSMNNARARGIHTSIV